MYFCKKFRFGAVIFKLWVFCLFSRGCKIFW